MRPTSTLKVRRVTRPPAPRERDIQAAILVLLSYDRRVAWADRQNTGGAYLKGRGGKPQFVRFGRKGRADVTGQLRDGRRLEIEVKRPGERPTTDQLDFINSVLKWNGVAGIAESVDDVRALLDSFCGDERSYAERFPARRDLTVTRIRGE